MKIAVFGIGNILLKDEGVGVHVLNELKSRYDFPDYVTWIDGGTMGLDLLPFFEGHDKVLIIDAAHFHSEPGTIGMLIGDEIPQFLSSKLSVHQIGLPDMLCASNLMEVTPKEIRLIGIQPDSIETGYGLTLTIQSKMDEIIRMVLLQLKEWGVEVKIKKSSKGVAKTNVSRRTIKDYSY